MPRPDDDDSDDAIPIRTVRKPSGTVVALCLVAALVIGGVVGSATTYFAPRGRTPATQDHLAGQPPERKPDPIRQVIEQVGPKLNPPAIKKTYSRDEFKQLVNGKTQQEVLALLGRPDKTEDDHFAEWKLWYYRDRAVDAKGSGKVDPVAAIYFSVNSGWKCTVDGFRDAMTRPDWAYR